MLCGSRIGGKLLEYRIVKKHLFNCLLVFKIWFFAAAWLVIDLNVSQYLANPLLCYIW